MTTEEIHTLHEYISDNNLVNKVEDRTKANWRGAGSRTTYYSAVSKGKQGLDLSLVEGLMLEEAHALMIEHKNGNAQLLAA